MKRISLLALFLGLCFTAAAQLQPVDVTGPTYDTPNQAFTKVNANDTYLEGLIPLPASYWQTSGATTITTPTIIGSPTFDGTINGTGTLALGSTGIAGVLQLKRSTEGSVIGTITQTTTATEFNNSQGSGHIFRVVSDPRLSITASTGVDWTLGAVGFQGSGGGISLGGSAPIASTLDFGGAGTVRASGSNGTVTFSGGPMNTAATATAFNFNVSTPFVSTTSGTATYTLMNLNWTFNTSGTYNGIGRGIYYNPTLTSTGGLTHIAYENTSGQIRLGGMTQDDTKTQVLVKDGTTNQVFYRDAATFAPSSGSANYWKTSGTTTIGTGVTSEIDLNGTNSSVFLGRSADAYLFVGRPVAGEGIVSLQAVDRISGGTIKLDFNTGNIATSSAVFTDGRDSPDRVGIVYGGDYSGTLVDLSLVPKIFVLGAKTFTGKQTFTTTATTAGVNLGTFAGDPSAPTDGDLWYNSTTDKTMARQNGVNVDLSAAGGGGGITNTAAANEIPKSDGTNIVPSGIFSTTTGDATLGSSGLAGNRTFNVAGSAADVSLTINSKATGAINLTTGSGGGSLTVSNNNVSMVGTGTSDAHILTAATNTVQNAFKLRHTTSGTPATGIGVGLEFETETAASNNEITGAIESVTTSVAAGNEYSDLVLKAMGEGTLGEAFRISKLAGPTTRLTVQAQSADISSTGWKFNANTTVTTNFKVGVQESATIDRRLHTEDYSTGTNTVLYPFRMTRAVQSGNGTTGVGVGMEFEWENFSGSNVVGGTIEAVATDATSGSEDSDMVFKNMSAGAAAAETFRVKSTGVVNIPIAPTNDNTETNILVRDATGNIETRSAASLSPVTVASLAADHAISATTATEVSVGATGLATGTYVFTYYIIGQSATTTVSPMFGINFTGTAAVRKMKLSYSGTGTAAITGVADDVGATTGQIEESVTVTAFTTTAPNMGATGGVATINADILYTIEGIMIVTASGDLELWHGSETATSTTVKAGTSLILTKVN